MSWYTGISGLNAATMNLNTTAHNISNASTAGFKNSRAEFGDVMGAGKPGIGVRTQAVNQLFQQGEILQTNQNGANGHLDLAVIGNGFFKLNGPNGEIYTRAGSFHPVDAAGKLVNNQGYELADALNLPTGSRVTGVKADGTLEGTDAEGQPLDATVKLYKFDNPGALAAVGDTAWAATAGSGAATAMEAVNVQVGALEQSNVNLTGELVNMIIAQRDYTANAKTITANDKITDVTMNISR